MDECGLYCKVLEIVNKIMGLTYQSISIRQSQIKSLCTYHASLYYFCYIAFFCEAVF